MKKTKFMRAAMLLLVLTLVTSCFVGGTFAKYTSSAGGNADARVAYWGFHAPKILSLDNLFTNSYTEPNGTTVTVKADEKVIAPGTSGSVSFSFPYTSYQDVNKTISAPEVDYDFTVNAEIDGDFELLTKAAGFRWTLKPAGADTATSYDTAADLVDAIKALSGADDGTGTKRYKAGTLPQYFNSTEQVHTIGWEWDFEHEDPDEVGFNTRDGSDTRLGNAGVPRDSGEQSLQSVWIGITIEATQVD